MAEIDEKTEDTSYHIEVISTTNDTITIQLKLIEIVKKKTFFYIHEYGKESEDILGKIRVLRGKNEATETIDIEEDVKSINIALYRKENDTTPISNTLQIIMPAESMDLVVDYIHNDDTGQIMTFDGNVDFHKFKEDIIRQFNISNDNGIKICDVNMYIINQTNFGDWLTSSSVIYSDYVIKLEDLNQKQMINVVTNICDKQNKLIDHKSMFLSWFEQNNTDGEAVTNLTHRTFTEALIKHCNGNKQLKLPCYQLFDELYFYDKRKLFVGFDPDIPIIKHIDNCIAGEINIELVKP
eukprot:539550_1